jgi:enamine deaminase RidA (YjgF/YER057c/UK114 family)
MNEIVRLGSGGPWEDPFGYCRVVAAGPWRIVGGCTSTVDGVVTCVGDPYGQARQAFQTALAALARVGATAAEVVRTRMYVAHPSHGAEVGRAHKEFFDAHRPVSTMVVTGLIHPDMLVEVEVEAYKR